MQQLLKVLEVQIYGTSIPMQQSGKHLQLNQSSMEQAALTYPEKQRLHGYCPIIHAGGLLTNTLFLLQHHSLGVVSFLFLAHCSPSLLLTIFQSSISCIEWASG